MIEVGFCCQLRSVIRFTMEKVSNKVSDCEEDPMADAVPTGFLQISFSLLQTSLQTSAVRVCS